MRNVFDQYNHSENRLTHALVASLAADPPILRGFIRWVTGEKAPATPLNIVEQTNPVYSGWVVSGEDRVRGIHEPLVSDDLFQTVQKRLNGKSTPHKKLNEDFPLRGVVRCATCGNPLTAGSVKGRSKHYARYWCWASDCKAVGVSREYLEGQFVSLLSRMQPTAESLAQLLELASQHWEVRKALIGADERRLKNRLADQNTLNQRALMARLKNEMSPEDLDVIKKAIDEEIHRIRAELSALDSERNTMEDLLKQAHAQAIDLVGTWERGSFKERHELAKEFFPEGLVFSHELLFFEPANTVIQEMLMRFLNDLSNVGVPDGI